MSYGRTLNTSTNMESNIDMRQDTKPSHKRSRSCYEGGTKYSPPPDTAKRATLTAPTRYDSEKERQPENKVWDLDEQVPELKRSFFEDYLLPPSPLPEKNGPEFVVNRLRDTGRIDRERGFWAGWPQPSTSGLLEDGVSKGFADLVKDIIEASEIPQATTINVICNPAFSLGYARKNTSKPDCYGIRKEAVLEKDPTTGKLQPKWRDVATPGEFKKNNTPDNFVNNAAKVLWSMNHIMREDPRRCFVIGFTIEDSSMRYWYCSRSDIFVSEAFDMLTEHATLVDFILRMSFATDAQLGWDSSISLYQPGGPSGGLQYDITVHGGDAATPVIMKFRTQKVISNLGAEALRGRGTRVWEVMRLNDAGEEVGESCVLKDSWVDGDRDREGEILARIHEAGDGLGPNNPVKCGIDRSLLTVVIYGDVRSNERVDKTRHWKKVPQHADVKTIRPRSKWRNFFQPSLTVVGGRVLEVEDEKKSESYTPYSPKVHHRIVFKEICKTIREVSSLAEAFGYLIQVIAALRCLHQLGWVHRDISAGNILVIDGVVKLADLEYARHEKDLELHEIRMGTPYFMSVEVDRTSYFFRAKSASRASKRKPVPTESSGKDKNMSIKGIPFRYNPLHDMESLMWLGWFLLLHTRLASIGPTPPLSLDRFTTKHRKLADKMFIDKVSRGNIMMTDAKLDNLIVRATLHDQVREVAEWLLECHTQLRTAFKSAEMDMSVPIPFTIAETHQLYQNYRENLANIVDILGETDIVVAPDQSSRDRLRKELCLDQAAKPEPGANGGDGGGDALADERPYKKQRTDDGTAALATRAAAQLDVGSRPRPSSPATPGPSSALATSAQ